MQMITFDLHQWKGNVFYVREIWVRTSGFRLFAVWWANTIHIPMALNVMSYSRDRQVLFQVWCHTDFWPPTYFFIQAAYILHPVFPLSLLSFNSSWWCKNKERKHLSLEICVPKMLVEGGIKKNTSKLNVENSCWAKNFWVLTCSQLCWGWAKDDFNVPPPLFNPFHTV